MKKIIYIEGMSCGHCTASVRKSLEAIKETNSVEVSLDEKKATVIFDKEIFDNVLTNAVEEAGYQVIRIE